MIIYKVSLALSVLLSVVCASIGESLHNETELLIAFGPRSLGRFEDLGDQTVLHWVYGTPSEKFLLRFSGTTNQTGGGISVHCADTPVHFVVRKEGIPVSNPENTSVPDTTIVQSSGVIFDSNFTLSERNQGQPHDIVIQRQAESSLLGHYFAAVYLPNQVETIDVAGLTKECKYYTKLEVHKLETDSNKTLVATSTSSSTDSVTELTREQRGLFNVHFTSNVSSYNLTTNSSKQFLWEIAPATDSGGNLNVKLTAVALPTEIQLFVNLSVSGYLKSQSDQSSGDWLDLQTLLLNDTTSGQENTWYVPYPISGPWLLDVRLNCTGNVSVCENITQEFEAQITVGSCIQNCQDSKGQGSCAWYRTDDILFTACRCKVGWRGIACTDGTKALSYAAQLERTLLLTLSNIVFLACVVLAIYRKFYTEALVYFFVAFMSTFYHACDQPGSAKYCMMKYETLQFSDFLSSVTAIWFTLVAVTKPPRAVESWLHVAGCLSFAVAVSYDRFSVFTVVIPAVIGVALVLLSWGLQCHKRRVCYPGKKKTAFSLLPGLAFAVTGLCLYAFVETSDNYYIIHSLWHIFMALAVLFLLPVGPKYCSKKTCAVDCDRFSLPFSAGRVGAENTYHSYSDTSLHLS